MLRPARRPRIPALLLVPGLAGALAGCATLVQGARQYVTVSARPAGAVARAGEMSCQTPCSLLLPRSSAVAVEIEAEGFEAARLRLEPVLDPLLLGNFCLPPLFIAWAVVDLASGAGFRLEPTYLEVDLRPQIRIARAGPAAPAQPPSASCVSAAP